MFKHRPLPDYKSLEQLTQATATPPSPADDWGSINQNVYIQKKEQMAAIQKEVDIFEIQLDLDLKVGFKVVAQYPSNAPGGFTLLLHKPE